MESMQPQIPRRRPMAEINVVPYIDVMLVLLIIFMVTAPMLVQSVKVKLPEVEATPTNITPDDDVLILTVDAGGRYFVERDDNDAKPMSLAAIIDYTGKISRSVKTTQVMIRGDEQVPYGKVVALMGGLQAEGIVNVGLITEAPATGATENDAK